MQEQLGSQNPTLSPRARFFASYTWLILRNLLGWFLILLSLVAGPLVPGPGGIPLFIIGFALVSFPGKRALTARVLRGTPLRFSARRYTITTLAIAAFMSAIMLMIAGTRASWLSRARAHGPLVIGLLYSLVVATIWLLAQGAPKAANIVLLFIAKMRRRFRPWFRRHWGKSSE